MLNAQQFEARRKGIGGSDVASILGLSPWKTAFQVYQEKVGESGQSEQTLGMSYGDLVEPVLRQWYSNETGQEVLLPIESFVHPENPWMLATVDGITREPRLIEIKTSRSSRGWGDPGTDDVPVYYATQGHHYMSVTGIAVIDFVVSFAGSMPVIYTMKADKEISEMLIEKEHEFWELVLNGTPPAPVTFADMVQRFRMSTVSEVTASIQVASAAHELKSVRQQMNELEAVEDKLKAEIMGFMRYNSVLRDVDGKVLSTWKNAKPSKRFDLKTFQSDEPELYKTYLKEGESIRKFLIK